MKRSRGLTIVEVSAAVAIIGLVFMLPKLASNLIHQIDRQKQFAQMQQETQVAIYSIIRDVRNCKRIVSVSDGSLVMAAYDHRKGYDSAEFFDAAKEATITYDFHSDGDNSYLQRKIVYFDGTSVTKQMLANLLIEPSSGKYLFSPMGTDLTGVNVALRCGHGYWRESPIIFEAQAMKRVFATLS